MRTGIELFQRFNCTDLSPRPPDGAFARSADGNRLSRAGSDEGHGVQITGLERQNVVHVLEQNRRVFGGLLNHRSIFLDRVHGRILRPALSRRRMVEIAELVDLVKHASGRAIDRLVVSLPSWRRFQKLARASCMDPKAPKLNGLGLGSSGRLPPRNPASSAVLNFGGGTGCGSSVVKKENIIAPRGLSFGPGPGISISRPLLM